MTVLLGITLKVSVVILVGLFVVAAARRHSAATRHWVIAASLLCALAIPALELYVPSWTIPTTSKHAAIVSATDDSTSVSPAPAAPASAAIDGAGAPISAAPLATTAVRTLLLLWGGGVAFCAMVLAAGLLRLAWIASHARVVGDGPWPRQLERIRAELGVRTQVRLLESNHPSLLVTWGLLRPKVVIPSVARTWSDDRIAIVLRHELAHIRRGDWILQIGGELLRAIYWFNPLIWIACARLRAESEQACDDEVLTSGVEGPAYATHLVELARLLKSENAPRIPAPAIARSSSLERRVTAMLDGRMTRTRATRVGRFATVAGLLSFTAALAAAQTGPVTLSGSVSDPTGAPVPGATVTLTNERTQAKFAVVSDQSGHFSFVPLPADTYALAAALPGFKQSPENVTLTGKSVRRDVKLALGELQETISIRSTPNEPAGPAKTTASRQYDRSGFQRDLEGCKADVSGGRVRPPRKIKDVKPMYPESARDAGIGGQVKLKTTIAVDGTVRDVQVVKSVSPEVDNAAIEAVRQWLFDGTLLNCEPVEVTMNVSLDFASK
jgi:TonB family protein